MIRKVNMFVVYVYIINVKNVLACVSNHKYQSQKTMLLNEKTMDKL